ncbi:hypothetical protein DCN14_31055 [Burkholderia sp. IDO3]|nr:hypothetical protein DCN14_31055 [Burkholderia sp. IDO3]
MHGTRAGRDALPGVHAMSCCACVPMHRSGAARCARPCGIRYVVPRVRQAVQTVGGAARRSISIGCARVAGRHRMARRLK